MGYSTVAAQSIFFIVVIIAAVGLAGIFNNYFDVVKSTVKTQTQNADDRIRTDFSISDVTATTTDVNASVRNIGETILDVNQVDVLISGTFISRNDTNVYVESSTDTRNPGLWDPFERIGIKISNVSLNSGETYEFKIETANGVTSTRKFTAE